MFRRAANQVYLMCLQAVRQCVIFWFFNGANTSKPVGCGSKSISVIIDQWVLSRNAAFLAVEFGSIKCGF